MVAAVVAVVGAASSAYAAKKAGDRADQQAEAMEAQGDVAQEQLEFGKDQYADWKEMFYPVLGDLKTQAYEEIRPNFAAISADVDTAFDTSQEANRRTMQRYGVNPTDGAFNASETQYGLGRAMATVNANNQARQGADQAEYNRLANFYAMGNGQQQTANSTVNQGFGSVMGAYGNQAALYGQQANQYSQMAAAGAGMMGRGIGMMMQPQAGGGGTASMGTASGYSWAGPDMQAGNPYAGHA